MATGGTACWSLRVPRKPFETTKL